MTGFHESSVWWLLLLLAVPFAWWRVARARSRAAIGFSSLAPLHSAGSSAFARLHWLPIALRTLALAIIAFSIARPIKANEHTRVFVEGIAIEVVVDRSSSMLALDFQLDGKPVDRLTAVKATATQFIAGGNGVEGRPNDLIGLVAFARFADSLCPLTLDHDYLLTVLNDIDVAGEAAEDGTAIGDAVALATERLRDATDRPDNPLRPKSKAIILLTDGENNAGEISPMTAAEVCKTLGIKLYAIGVGTIGTAPFPTRSGLGGTTYVRMPVRIDEKLLKEMAAETGGDYFRATDTQSLERIYKTISELEKTTTEQRRYLQYRDLAVEPIELAGVRLPPLLLIALLLVAVELVLSNTRWRTLP
ncbi:MAG: VWA domain-containing protein [Phycisphaerae bacterium]|nr:VWA domain-containing protein [Phycisphaerae bacterium]